MKSNSALTAKPNLTLHALLHCARRKPVVGLLPTLQVEAANEEHAAVPEGDLRSHKATISYHTLSRYHNLEKDRRLPEAEVAKGLLPTGLSFTTALPPTAILQAVDP